MTVTIPKDTFGKWVLIMLIVNLATITMFAVFIWSTNHQLVNGCQKNNALVVQPLRDFAHSAQRARAAGPTALDGQTAEEHLGYVVKFQEKLDTRCEELYSIFPF